ncbi:hypothetical protein METBIDRAFT_45381 [Metschnikowia bicuspidata var. bicuspidata NRRL YB-4993]|uniref:Uncharacterized protein n=1 Tax=Metschnikowia bicuspidata var. bicuspidata NRRL YB-4993 TaxID=869754 RepID=A0A1A0H6Z1_9ASCO|nr:hypothetical protein METBIDRAFT_45381 [Metschnikowia bicuspidata var. bicuspidata NRRL YB-4993]OBA19801.1 hypothetical protein METBIDRAFT_45381 [Metschnikowia bicuspidata var. bicuspidata NRRL YB-4993]
MGGGSNGVNLDLQDEIAHQLALTTTQSVPESDTLSLYSAALSDAETLMLTRDQCLHLQATYQDNFTSYIPYLLETQWRGEEDSDDDRTMVSRLELPILMHRSTTSYNYKRTLIIASELIRNSVYVFPDAESYELFKHLRACSKKMRKNSVVLYDEDSNIQRIHSKRNENDDTVSFFKRFASCTIDSRSHIIPLDYKVKGLGLPLFKIVVPYMSIFRRKTPYMIFRKYLEKPKPPTQSETIEDEQFETFDFCTVHIKTFQQYKRYTFVIQPEDGPQFKVLAFQNNYRPFTDFNYKDTRFRVFGTPIAMAYLAHYNPELKLHILDRKQPSLMDNLIERKTSVNTSVQGKLQSSGEELSSSGSSQKHKEPQDAIPHPHNPILLLNIESVTSATYNRTVPHEMPPFGRFLDACVYRKNAPLLPKKYSEVGKIDVYQDPSEMANPNHSSSLSVDLDSLVLSTILLTLRETNVRTTVKHPGQSHSSKMGLLTAIALNSGGSMNTSAVI